MISRRHYMKVSTGTIAAIVIAPQVLAIVLLAYVKSRG